MVALCVCQTHAQDSLVLKQLSCYHYLYDSTENKIGFGCGFVGVTTTNLYLIRELIIYSRFDLISKLLDSKITSTRYLSCVALIQANKGSYISIDSITQAKINLLKKDKHTIPFCNGCTRSGTYTINNLLDKKSKIHFAEWTEAWMIDSFKKEE